MFVPLIIFFIPRFQESLWNLALQYLVGIPTPLKNDGVRQLGWWHSHLFPIIIWKNKIHVPNHQPAMVIVETCKSFILRPLVLCPIWGWWSGTSFLVTFRVLCGLPLYWDVLTWCPWQAQKRVWWASAGNRPSGKLYFRHFWHKPQKEIEQP